MYYKYFTSEQPWVPSYQIDKFRKDSDEVNTDTAARNLLALQ